MERNRESMIAYCRYYRGEQENPHNGGDAAAFWGIEKAWVDKSLAQSDDLVVCADEYAAAGLTDFETGDGVPALLKAILYNRFVYWTSGTPSDFKSFYKCRYLG